MVGVTITAAWAERSGLPVFFDYLDIPGFLTTGVHHQGTHDLVTAELILKMAVCPKCHQTGCLTRCGFEREPRTFFHVPRGKPCLVTFRCPRYECSRCHAHPSHQPIPGIDEKHSGLSSELLKLVSKRLSWGDPFTRIAYDAGPDESIIRDIDKEQLAVWEKERVLNFPEIVGMDEVQIRGVYRFVVTDLTTNRLLEMFRSRKKPAVSAKLRQLFRHPERVRIVVIDMHRPYYHLVRELFPKATIIIDVFHVLRLANKCLNSFRVSLGEQLRQEEIAREKENIREFLGTEAANKRIKQAEKRGQKKKNALLRDRKLFGSRYAALSPKAKLRTQIWFAKLPQLREAHARKEALYDIWYTALTAEEAKEQFDAWKAELSPEMKVIYADLLRAVRNWRKQIFEYFRHNERPTNGYTEAVNGLIKLQNALGRGYKFATLRGRMLRAEPRPRKFSRRARLTVPDAIALGKPEIPKSESVVLTAGLLADVDAPKKTSKPEPLKNDPSLPLFDGLVN